MTYFDEEDSRRNQRLCGTPPTPIGSSVATYLRGRVIVRWLRYQLRPRGSAVGGGSVFKLWACLLGTIVGIAPADALLGQSLNPEVQVQTGVSPNGSYALSDIRGIPARVDPSEYPVQ